MGTAWLPLEWIVSLRFLREGRLQTVFIITGVAIGVGVIVFMSALLSGMQANFIRRVLSTQSHIQLLQPQQVTRPLRSAGRSGTGPVEGAIVQPPLQQNKSIDQWQAVVQQVRAMAGVRVVSPVANGPLLVVRGSSTKAVNITGIEPESYYRIVNLDEKLLRGVSRLAASDVMIGSELAADLGVDVGDKLHVTSAAGRSSVLTISGVFDLGNRGSNRRDTFTTLHTAQSLLDMPGGVSTLEVTVQDIYAAETIAQQIAVLTVVEADSWIKNSAQFFAAVSAQTTANTAIRFFVGLSVAFGIASVLVVSVVQKSREIGILRAMGISQGQILRVFLLQGGLLGLGGAVAGCGVGALAIFLWKRLALNADGTVMFPLEMEAPLFVSALVLAGLTGLVAAFAPALRAARMDPVVAIRG
jgi:lipoprotein-releasing system permease protein